MNSKIENVFPAKVVSILDYSGFKLVINRGAEQGIKIGQRFLIYSIGDEMFDPDTKESLGRIEIVKGKGKVIHVQEKMATIESEQIKNERKIRKSSNNMFYPRDSEEELITPTNKPFDDAKVGDLAKPI